MEFFLIVDVIDEDMMGDVVRLIFYLLKVKVLIDMGDEIESKFFYLFIFLFWRFYNVWVG